MTAQEHAERIALALEAGPTPGPWEFGSYAGGEVRIGPFDCSKHAPFCVMTGRAAFPWNNTTESEQAFNDADFIASCDPAALTALLSERTALLARVGELEGALSTIAKRMDSRWPDDCIANVTIARAALKGQP